MPKVVAVRELPETEFDQWTRLVTESPDGSIYSLPEYLELICREAGGRFRILGAWRGDELIGGVGLYERDSRFGVFVASRLLLYYNGLVLKRYDTKYPSQRTSRDLKAMAAISDAIRARGYAWVMLRSRGTVRDVRPFLAAGWTATPSYTYVVPIGDLERLWQRTEQNFRRLVKRTERDGMTVGDDDDFDSFFRLHKLTMDRKTLGQYLPERSFRRYFETLRERGASRLYHARGSDGRAVSSQLVLLGPGSMSHSVAAATDPEFLRSGVTALLRWKVFCALNALGFGANDLTDAGLNPVTRFKSQLGGDLEMSFILERPQTWGYRIGSGVDNLYWRSRVAAGALARRAGLMRS